MIIMSYKVALMLEYRSEILNCVCWNKNYTAQWFPWKLSWWFSKISNLFFVFNYSRTSLVNWPPFISVHWSMTLNFIFSVKLLYLRSLKSDHLFLKFMWLPTRGLTVLQTKLHWNCMYDTYTLPHHCSLVFLGSFISG